MRCAFIKTENHLTCVRCGRILNIDIPPDQIRARCWISEPDDSHRRYIYQIAGPPPHWEFLYLTPRAANSYNKNLIQDDPDESRVGTWLTDFFSALGYESKGAPCNCKSLAFMFDQASWNFLNSNQSLMVDLIINSARQINQNPSKLAVSAAVKLALFKNRPRRKRGTGPQVPL